MKRSLRIEILGFVFHFALATIGIGFVCFVVGFFVFVLGEKTGLSLGNGESIFGTAYNPWFWIPAGLSGYFVNRVSRNRSACVVGGVALLLLFALMSRDVSFHQQNPYYSQLINDQYHGHYWRYEFEQLLSPSDANAEVVNVWESYCLLFPSLPQSPIQLAHGLDCVPDVLNCLRSVKLDRRNIAITLTIPELNELGRKIGRRFRLPL